MLDLIEYLARWARGPAAARLPGARRAARPPPRLGRRAAERDDARRSTRSARSRRMNWSPRCSASGGAPARASSRRRSPSRSGGNPLFAEEMVNRILEEGRGRGRGAARDGALGARRAAGLAAALGAPRAPARRGGRSDVLGGLGRRRRRARARPPRRRSSRCGRRTSWSPTAGSRLAGEREYAFKHVLIRDVAYSTLPKAVRARQHAEVGSVHLATARPTAPRA